VAYAVVKRELDKYLYWLERKMWKEKNDIRDIRDMMNMDNKDYNPASTFPTKADAKEISSTKKSKVTRVPKYTA
jgi:hypothetical protein